MWRCWGENEHGETHQPAALASAPHHVQSASIGRKFVCMISKPQTSPEIFGSLQCWGLDSHAQTQVPEVLTTLIYSVEAGDYHVCAKKKSKFGCWGSNTHGQLDVPFSHEYVGFKAKGYSSLVLSSDGQVQVYGHLAMSMNVVLSKITKFYNNIIVLGQNHVCMYGEELQCIGSDEQNQTKPPEIEKVDQMRSQGNHTCTITDEWDKYQGGLSLRCWGDNSKGQLIDIEQPYLFNDVSTGDNHSCYIIGINYLKCHGTDKYYLNSIPNEIKEFYQIISAGGDFTCFNIGGELSCVGKNKNKLFSVPKEVKHGTHEIAAGYNHVCASSINHFSVRSVIWCWGFKPSERSLTVPEHVNFDYQVTFDLSSGFKFSCAIVFTDEYQSKQIIVCWGLNDHDQLTPYSAHPSLKGHKFIHLVSGAAHSCVVSVSGVPRCWGLNSQGQTRVPGSMSSQVQQVAAGHQHTCAASLNQRGSCWGQNNAGQADMPFLVAAGVQSVFCGGNHSCAIDAERKVSCWGSAKKGQTEVPRLARQAPRKLSLGESHTCSAGQDGKVRCWGSNEQGQILLDNVRAG